MELTEINKVMDGIEVFIDRFLVAVDFQESVALTAETPLDTLGEWDSLAALGVIIMFDAEYGIAITGSDLKNCETINDIYMLTKSNAH